MNKKVTLALAATYDTKGEDAQFIADSIQDYGVESLTIDVGVGGSISTPAPDISFEQICDYGGYKTDEIYSLPRGEAVKKGSELFKKFAQHLVSEDRVQGLAGMGGAGGTQIATHAMRDLPFGFPKLVLSTLASGNTRWYLKESDIIMVPSIVDIAGVNAISRISYKRFANIVAQVSKWYVNEGFSYPDDLSRTKGSPALRVSQTMYGTTTPGVSEARHTLQEKGFESVVFHASGAGGMAMERFIESGVIDGVLDTTLAELGGYLLGGLHSAGPDRLQAATKKGIPQVIVPGAADTVVLPPLDKLPSKFENRTLNEHNPTMTTMRTNQKECAEIGQMICKNLSPSRGPVKVVLPLEGLSSLDRPNKKFHHPSANQRLFEEIKKGLADTNVEVLERREHINDEGFAQFIAKLFANMVRNFYEVGTN